MFWQPGEGIPGIIPNCTNYGLGSEELLELRERGLTIKSGPQAGTVSLPTSLWCLKGMQGTVLATAPKLVTTMLAQIWVAHPTLRTEYMVLDPNAWDTMPPPLIDLQIWKTTLAHTSPKKIREQANLPWDS
jgi:hypothetical protein